MVVHSHFPVSQHSTRLWRWIHRCSSGGKHEHHAIPWVRDSSQTIAPDSFPTPPPDLGFIKPWFPVLTTLKLSEPWPRVKWIADISFVVLFVNMVPFNMTCPYCESWQEFWAKTLRESLARQDFETAEFSKHTRNALKRETSYSRSDEATVSPTVLTGYFLARRCFKETSLQNGNRFDKYRWEVLLKIWWKILGFWKIGCQKIVMFSTCCRKKQGSSSEVTYKIILVQFVCLFYCIYSPPSG